MPLCDLAQGHYVCYVLYNLGGDYFEKSAQFSSGYESGEVRSWIELEIQEKSYEKVAQCLEKITGSRVYSSNQVGEKVKEYAQESTMAVTYFPL